uniref:Plasma membrane fusion protein PRM1 n=1 Tax=Panagrolaimus superbus TaxID=310955 RepID=A0A914Z180_9BILA
MSVDKTIEELSQTLSQLSILVEHINGQIVGVTSRINITLDNFDNSVGGIAKDASALTGQVGDTVSQIPNSWVFYLLFITLIVVLILLSILIIINLVTKAHAIYRLCFPDAAESEANTPLPSNYSESRLLQRYDNSLQRFPKATRNDIAIPIEDARINTTSFPMDSSGINPSFHNNGFQTGRPNLGK